MARPRRRAQPSPEHHPLESERTDAPAPQTPAGQRHRGVLPQRQRARRPKDRTVPQPQENYPHHHASADETPPPLLQNKTNSAVQLKHIPTGIVIKSQATRSRSQNRKIARQLLAERLDDLENGDQSRNAIVAEAKRKKAASAAKKSKRKYRKLEDAGRHDGQPGDDITATVAPETDTGRVQVPTNLEKTNPTDGKPSIINPI
ncbi:peptidyl-tRNA hydrolase domain-containing protein [Verticillium alfalfae VaMs.102]|uniref:Peptidyl-tRNA hydrolase domain-containing protein n=1 Tax=Verticillium alfalfae (strain VaMs.102 / ATCC MYA-4576 / FGSC 10136) TaxID=526221 RepID=C9S8X5_VERA1|nr:peptidyl-tRNA hydrolase domain-containing protein [Verticillium alfalfae VaMs.102]EEY14052.1 peptidyl-tRNA hydrolase domain-containing protein [Verticillium alfalfae VaMs.102]